MTFSNPHKPFRSEFYEGEEFHPMPVKCRPVVVFKCKRAINERKNMPPYGSCGVTQVSGRPSMSNLICPSGDTDVAAKTSTVASENAEVGLQACGTCLNRES